MDHWKKGAETNAKLAKIAEAIPLRVGVWAAGTLCKGKALMAAETTEPGS